MSACLFSESSDSQETKKLKYRYNTTKTLEMARVFLVKKDSAEKEQEEVGEKKIIFLINKIFKAWYANRTSTGESGFTLLLLDGQSICTQEMAISYD